MRSWRALSAGWKVDGVEWIRDQRLREKRRFG